MSWKEATDPALRAIPFGSERRRGPKPMPWWKHLGMILGVVAAALTVLGACMKFLRPSIVTSLEVMPKKEAEEKFTVIDTRLDKLEGIDGKLDILVEDVKHHKHGRSQ